MSCPTSRRDRTPPGTVTLAWRTDPVKTDAVDRWLLEALPPGGPSRAPTPNRSPGSSSRATSDAAPSGSSSVRTTSPTVPSWSCASPRSTRTGSRSCSATATRPWTRASSSRCAGRPSQLDTGGRRASTPSLAQARLDAALDGQDDLREDAPGWSGGALLAAAGRAAHRPARAEPGTGESPAPRAR